jgi:hypothetical protein
MFDKRLVGTCFLLIALLWQGTREETIKPCTKNQSDNGVNTIEDCMKIIVRKDMNFYNALSEYFTRRSSFQILLEEYKKETQCEINRKFGSIQTSMEKKLENLQKSIDENTKMMWTLRQKNFSPFDDVKTASTIKKIAGRNLKLKSIYSTNISKIFHSRNDCIQFCFNSTDNPNNEVCQIEYFGCQPTQFKCTTSPVPGKYFNAFPNRYLDTVKGHALEVFEVYYNIPSDDSFKKIPILFYSLDDLSQNINLGSLDAVKYSLDMGPTASYYECQFTPGQTKVLRLNPANKFLIQIPHVTSIPFTSSSNFTLLTWMKKFNLNDFGPLIEATSSGHTVAEWWMWNWKSPNEMHPRFGREPYLVIPSVNIHEWNFIAMRVNGTTLDLFVNNKLVGSVTQPMSHKSLGDRIYIGRRIGNPNNFGGTDHMFDGCMANLMIFTDALTEKEMSSYGNIKLDSRF